MNRSINHRVRLGAAALACVAAGAGASAIAAAGAATTPAKHPELRGAITLRQLSKRVVEGKLVVATKSGFADVTVARGTVQSVAGQQITITEGTRTRAYQTVTLTLPATTTVRDDKQASTLGNVSPGQRALVVDAPNRALVIAHTPRAG